MEGKKGEAERTKGRPGTALSTAAKSCFTAAPMEWKGVWGEHTAQQSECIFKKLLYSFRFRVLAAMGQRPWLCKSSCDPSALGYVIKKGERKKTWCPLASDGDSYRVGNSLSLSLFFSFMYHCFFLYCCCCVFTFGNLLLLLPPPLLHVCDCDLEWNNPFISFHFILKQNHQTHCNRFTSGSTRWTSSWSWKQCSSRRRFSSKRISSRMVLEAQRQATDRLSNHHHPTTTHWSRSAGFLSSILSLSLSV